VRGRSVLAAAVAATLCLGGGAVAAGAAARPAIRCAKSKATCANATGETAPRKMINRLRAGQVPIDYTAVAGLSQPTFTGVERTTKELFVGDNTRLHLEIVKPKGAENLGVILEASPYHGTLYDRTGARMIPLPGKDGKDGKLVGLSGFFPQRGYAVVFMDMRGTGLSSGCLNSLGRNDQSDLRDVIAWAASQEWSNGRVGMIGHSYVGSTPIIATIGNPKGLVTIVPSAGLPSMYDHQWQLGVPYNAQYLGPIEAYQQLALQRELPFQIELPNEGGMTGEHFGKDLPATGCGLQDTSLSSGEQLAGVNTPWHKLRDASKAAAAWDGSAFVIHGENDQAARIANLHWLYDRGPKTQDKVWIGQWDHGIGCCPNRRGAQWAGAIHAWLDKQLLRRKVATGPPVEVFMNDEPTVDAAVPARGEIYTSPSWPPAVARTLTLRASADGSLGEAPGAVGAPSFAGDPGGFLFATTGNLTFATAPFAEDTILLGLPKLTLASSVTMQPLNLIATLYSAHAFDVRRISQCAMNPQLRTGADRIAPVIPGSRMQLHPPCFTVSQHVRAGDRLILEISTSDVDKLPLFAIDPHVTVFTGGADGTKLDLPVATGRTYPDTAPIADGAVAP
jgi:putative CocE/NonD family hydrolase